MREPRGITQGHFKLDVGGKSNFSPPPGGNELLMYLSSRVNLVRTQEEPSCQVERLSNRRYVGLGKAETETSQTFWSGEIPARICFIP